MPEPDRLPAADLPPGTVRRSGDWAVGNRGTADDDRYFAVSRRCRHQLADLSEGASTPTAAWSARGTRAATTSGPARWSRARAASSATTGRRRATPSWSRCWAGSRLRSPGGPPRRRRRPGVTEARSAGNWSEPPATTCARSAGRRPARGRRSRSPRRRSAGRDAHGGRDLLGRLRLQDAVADLLGPVAADQPPRRELAQHRHLVVAPGLLPPRAAGVEPAAARRVRRRRQVTGQQDPLAPLLDDRVGHRDGAHQRARVGVQRLLVQVVGRRLLDQRPEVHDADDVADVPDDGEVVGDDQVGEPEPLLQLLEQVEHLRLHADVERGDRLVGDEQVRLERDGAGDADALPLAAGELVRVAAPRAPPAGRRRRAGR